MATKLERLFDFPYYQLEHHPLERMMHSRVAGEWTHISTQEFVHKMNLVSRGLMAIGVKPGDRVALITHCNRMEWDIMDHGIMQMGAVDVPIYPTMTSEDCKYILNHSESVYCFVSNAELFEKINAIAPDVPSLRGLFTFEHVAHAVHWSELFTHAERVDEKEVKTVADRVQASDLATIIYTSGTTGLPKGVMLSHQNIASNAVSCEERLPLLVKGKSRCLSFLPISHIYERMLHYLYVQNGVEIYLSGMDQIKEDLMIARPNIFTGVPRLFEKFYDGIYAKGMSNTGVKRSLFKWAHSLALRWEPEGANGWWYELQLGIARKLVFSKVKSALGLTEIGAVASGSAALQSRLARFFNGAGIPVQEGYGLTETSPVITVNTFRSPHMFRVGYVGKVISGVEIRLAEDGEILCKGPNVMMGYYRNPEQSAEVLRDGWFYTGDIGIIEDGFLKITDRKKELFKTSGGKYVAPQVIENALKELHWVEQAMVIGDGQKFPSALIVPAMDALRSWAAEQKLGSLNQDELLTHASVLQQFRKDIDSINTRFGNWEQVKSFRLLPRPFDIEHGEITPTLKLKRKQIMQNWSAFVADIYKNQHGE